eukprot:789038-Amphidinium_carterae.1
MHRKLKLSRCSPSGLRSSSSISDIPIQDWVKLAVTRAKASGSKAISWLDEKRGHDAVMIGKVKQYLQRHDTQGDSTDTCSTLTTDLEKRSDARA